MSTKIISIFNKMNEQQEFLSHLRVMDKNDDGGMYDYLKSRKVELPEGQHYLKVNLGKHQFWTPVIVYEAPYTKELISSVTFTDLKVNGVYEKTFPLMPDNLANAMVFPEDPNIVFEEFLKEYPLFQKYISKLDGIAKIRIMSLIQHREIDAEDEIGTRNICKEVLQMQEDIRRIFENKSSIQNSESFIEI